MKFLYRVIIGAALLMLIAGGCSSTSGPTTSTVIIPGPGSTFTYLNTSDTNGVTISSDTTRFLVLSIGNHAGFSDVISIQRTTSVNDSARYSDTIYIRVLSTGDISEYLSLGDHRMQWFDLPFGSGKSQSQESDSISPSINNVPNYDTTRLSATAQGLTFVRVKGMPILAQTVNYTEITNGLAVDNSTSNYSIQNTLYYSIPSRGILFAGSRDSGNHSTWAGGDLQTDAFASPSTSTLIDYKILP